MGVSLTRYPGRWWTDRVRREPYRDCGLTCRTGYGDLMVLAPIPDGVWGRPWKLITSVKGSRVAGPLWIPMDTSRLGGDLGAGIRI
ncbi:hypothetical protein T01_1515 [Trichinella spiralis]|uniref:Uncharacterized protein n=1 Tax=Trichinella spiralis TaxID=6334 RepID=A0A0V1AJN4_TRISP|nr:hypothetical protein T01_1515 [Trichinella spiralis]